MLLHRCVSMGSGWVGGWTDGRTHTSACWQCCELRVMQPPGMLDSRHRVPVPISGPHPIAIPSTRHSAPKHPFVPGCADGQHRASPGPDPPLSSPDPAPPPTRISPRAVPAGPWKWGRTAPGAPTAGPSACCGHPAPAGLSLRGAWPRPPPRSGGSGWGGGAEPRRPYAPPQRSRPGSAQIGSARLGSARRGAVHAAPPQLGGEEDWRGVRGGRGAEDARFGAARFGCAHPSAAPQPRVDPAAFRGCRSRPRAAAALRVTLLFLLRPLPSERESRAAAAAAALRVLRLGNLQRDRGCFDREHWAGPACALRGCGVRERSRVGRGRNKTGSAAGRLRTGLLLKELLTRYRWLLALPTCPFLTLHITHFHLPSAQDDP